MIELAPEHKMGLCLPNSLMTAAGCFGYGVEYADLMDVSWLGAVVTNPVTLRPQRGAPQPRLVELSDGFVLNTGDQNPGVRQVIRRFASHWRRLPVSVVVHLAADVPDSVRRTACALASTGAVAALEIELPNGVTGTGAARLLAAARDAELPLLAQLPLHDAVDLATACVEAVADALVVATPLVGAARHLSGTLVTGRLYGRAVHALVLPVLEQVRTLVDVPLIACGGVHSPLDVRTFLDAGAVAVQVDSVLFRDPSFPVSALAAGET